MDLYEFQKFVGLKIFLGGWQMAPFVSRKQCNMNLLKIGESSNVDWSIVYFSWKKIHVSFILPCPLYIASATVLYDQPPEFFHPTSLKEKHEVNHWLLFFFFLFGSSLLLFSLCDLKTCHSCLLGWRMISVIHKKFVTASLVIHCHNCFVSLPN